MDKNDLYNSIGEVDDALLFRTEPKTKCKRPLPFIPILAASLALIIGIFGLSFLLRPDNPSAPSSWFVVTAYANDGVRRELDMNAGCFNSGGTGGNLFNVDFPLFEFSVDSAKWKGNESFYSDFEISVSYNGKIVDGKDKHVIISYQVPAKGHSGTYSYIIIGWFEEPTDITVTITNKNSGKIVERITVNVCYVPEAEAYKLTVTDVKTDLEKK